MSYEGRLASIQKFVPSAIDRLLTEDFAEAAVSWDRSQVVSAIVAKIKLDAPELHNSEDAYAVCESALYQLLRDSTIKPKHFGYSSLGHEEVQDLFRRYHVEVQPESVVDTFEDIRNDYTNLSADQLNERRKNPAWLQRFNAACTAGAI